MVVVPSQAEEPTLKPPHISDWTHFYQPEDGATRLLDVIEATRFLTDLTAPLTSTPKSQVDFKAEGVMAMLVILGREMELAYAQLTAVKT